MKKTTIALLSIATLVGLSGCGNDTPSSAAAKTYSKQQRKFIRNLAISVMERMERV